MRLQNLIFLVFCLVGAIVHGVQTTVEQKTELSAALSWDPTTPTKTSRMTGAASRVSGVDHQCVFCQFYVQKIQAMLAGTSGTGATSMLETTSERVATHRDVAASTLDNDTNDDKKDWAVASLFDGVQSLAEEEEDANEKTTDVIPEDVTRFASASSSSSSSSPASVSGDSSSDNTVQYDDSSAMLEAKAKRHRAALHRSQQQLQSSSSSSSSPSYVSAHLLSARHYAEATQPYADFLPATLVESSSTALKRKTLATKKTTTTTTASSTSSVVAPSANAHAHDHVHGSSHYVAATLTSRRASHQIPNAKPNQVDVELLEETAAQQQQHRRQLRQHGRDWYEAMLLEQTAYEQQRPAKYHVPAHLQHLQPATFTETASTTTKTKVLMNPANWVTAEYVDEGAAAPVLLESSTKMTRRHETPVLIVAAPMKRATPTAAASRAPAAPRVLPTLQQTDSYLPARTLVEAKSEARAQSPEQRQLFTPRYAVAATLQAYRPAQARYTVPSPIPEHTLSPVMSAAYARMETYCTYRTPQTFVQYCGKVLHEFFEIAKRVQYLEHPQQICAELELCSSSSYITKIPHSFPVKAPLF